MRVVWRVQHWKFKTISPFTVLCIPLCVYFWVMSRASDDLPEVLPEELPLLKKGGSVKKIAFWTTLWSKSAFGISPEERRLNCGINLTCQLYDAKRHPLRYDALVFHGRDPQRPPLGRSPDQAYIMLLQESPAYEYKYVPGANFYNWTMTYSRKSDFRAPYFTIRKRNVKEGTHNQIHYGTLSVQYNEDKPPGLKAVMHHSRQVSEAMVLWIVSHCNTTSHRELYVEALRKYLPVDAYGKCATDCIALEQQSGLQCHDYLSRTGHYKFYLSFENSACRDYITEKVYEPLQHGLVPIVYGGLSTKDYVELLPPGSFIDVRNFTSPKQLAEYLLYLDRNNEAYLAYHAWREHWDIGGGNVWLDDWEAEGSGSVWCDVCRALHNVGKIPTKNVDWAKFWNPATECDDHLLEKVLGNKV